jgi:hypothetical protein
MASEMTGEIPLEEVQQRVHEALGRHYKVTAKSDSVIKVQRFPFVTENIHVKWQGDRTTLQPAPGGVWFVQGINALSIHQRVRHLLSRAFVETR